MSLIRKQNLTEKNLAAKRSNGGQARGAATPAGKARSAAARLRHGFYSQARDEALVALGEDPKQYARLLKSLVDDLQPRAGLENELVLRMGRALWRMQRAERMQDGLAVKRAQSGLQLEELVAGPRMIRINDIYEALCDIGRMLDRDDSTPGPGEIEALVGAFGDAPPAEVQELFPLLRSYGEAASKAPRPANETGEAGPIPLSDPEQRREAARQQLEAALHEVSIRYRMSLDMVMEECGKVRSPQNIAALMAPRDENALLMQRMEDSNLRQLWRLTKMFLMVKHAPAEAEGHESSSDGDYVYEKISS